MTTIELQPYEVTVTEIRQRTVTETVPVTITRMVTEQKTVVVPTIHCRQVSETVSRQVPVCVPYQVPVTVMTTQLRPVTHQVPAPAPAHPPRSRPRRPRPGSKATSRWRAPPCDPGGLGEGDVKAECSTEQPGHVPAIGLFRRQLTSSRAR